MSERARRPLLVAFALAAGVGFAVVWVWAGALAAWVAMGAVGAGWIVWEPVG